MTIMDNRKLMRKNLYAINQKVLSQKETIFFCFATVLFWGLLAHGYGFLHSNLSHDVLNAFAATNVEEAWKIELGRFFVPLYRSIFRGPILLPWLIGILGLMWTAIAVFLVVKIFDIRSKVLIALIAGITTTNISYIAQIATYLYEFDFNALALMLSVLAVFLWNRNQGILSIILGGICVMASIAIYQAYFAVTVTLIVWKCILDLFCGKEIRTVLIHGSKGILLLLLGKLVYDITQIQPQSRTDVFSAAGENPFQFYLGLIIPAIRHLLIRICPEAYGRGIFVIFLCVIVALITLSAIRISIIKKFRFTKILVLLLLLVLLPFAMTCVFILAKGMGGHDLMNYVFCFFYIFVIQFAFRICKQDMLPNTKSRILRAAACVLIGVILWNNVVLSNTAYMKKEMEANATLSTMTRVVSLMEQHEEYTPGETKVAFIGVAENTNTLFGMERVSTIIGLESNSSISRDASLYFYNAYKAYFEYVLQYPILFCADDIHAELKEDPRVEALPTFPQKGCMEMIDEVFVIKMG